MNRASLYDKTITVLNKLPASASATKQDTWYKTVLDKCAWYVTSVSDVVGNAVVVAEKITVLIPFHEEFLPFMQWKEAGQQVGHYTMSTGDYIVLGEVAEEITSSNVVSVMKSYGRNVCTVKSARECDMRLNNLVQLSIEGV